VSQLNLTTIQSTQLADIVPELRSAFPSLRRTHAGKPIIYLDGPAGSQVPQSVVDAISNYYLHHNANRSGKFATSQETDQLLNAAHRAGADWFGTDDPAEVVFGANMTTMTFSFSRALARTWKPGDRILVTQLDHDGNVTPWRLAARDAGVEVCQVQVNPRDATLDLCHLEQLLKTPARLVAVTGASNSVGSRTDISHIVRLAHAAGAEIYLDAVHWAPHCLIDVKLWDVDYCICSAYKFFGPHVGMLYGKRSRLEELEPYKLRPAPGATPGKWMTGTQNHAAICGVTAAIDYVASIGNSLVGNDQMPRRDALRTAFAEIEKYETALVAQLLLGLQSNSRLTLYGITDPQRLHQRVPTVALNVRGRTSAEIAQWLGEQGIFCWHGDYYAVDVCAALGQQPAGMVRLGLMHTNTAEEVRYTLEAFNRLN
jgi:cysteine desulfurase family protein (TIGR01976 family)